MAKSIGFIGYGEVGQCFAGELARAGRAVSAFDVRFADPQARKILQERADEAGVSLVASLEDLARDSDIIISAVTSAVALAAARDAAGTLETHHTYIDLNSTRPAVKKEIAAIIEAGRARFVEAAVMAAIPTFGLKVPILLCGAAAQDIVEELTPDGMVLEVLGPEIGAATATKMFRSIVVKGLEALLLECALASAPYGVTEKVLDYVEQGYPGVGNDLAHFLLGRTALHGERRAHELEEVAETLRSMGIEPIMAEAGSRRLGGAAKYNLKRVFGDTAPKNYHEVIAAIRNASDPDQA